MVHPRVCSKNLSTHLATATRPLAAADNLPTRGGQDVCSKIREREQCTPKECVWCQNKYTGSTYSPFAGSDGVCVDKSQQSYLPAMTYDCKRVKPAANIDIRTSVSGIEAGRESDADSTGNKTGIAAA